VISGGNNFNYFPEPIIFIFNRKIEIVGLGLFGPRCLYATAAVTASSTMQCLKSRIPDTMYVVNKHNCGKYDASSNKRGN